MKVAVSGYFDPLHVGHIEYLEMARRLADSRALQGDSLWGALIVIVNNDYPCALKKGQSFMPEVEEKVKFFVQLLMSRLIRVEEIRY